MASLYTETDHRSHPLSRRMFPSGIIVIAATLALAACGGTSVTTAPAATTPATTAPAATVAVSGGQAQIAPTGTPAATQTAPTTAPITAPTSVATVAAAATRPPAANANAESAAGKADPCVLVTKADYLAVMGDAAKDPVKKDQPRIGTPGFVATSCDYKIAAGGKVEFVTVNVMQRDASVPAGVDTKTYWDSVQAKVTPLPEIGPEVFLVVNPLLEQIGAGGAVHFFKGDVIFDVQAVTGSGTVVEQNAAGTVAAKKLTTLAFGRL